MKRWILGLSMVLGLIGILSPAVWAADKKPLKEMLFEKGVLTKDEAAMVQDVKLSSALDRIIFSGDFRLRHESFMRELSTDPSIRDQHRQRFRLRVGSEIKVSEYMVMIRLASGSGEAVSTNQSFDNLFTQKAIYIDQAFLKWQGGESRWLTLAGGRMQNPFWRVYSTDIVFDDDLNPEGFAEMMTWKAGETTVFVNLGQFVLDEDGTDNNDQWLLGQQVGASFVPTKDVTAMLALAYYDAMNTRENNFRQNPSQSGNTKSTVCDSSNLATANDTNCKLVNDYNVLDLTAQVATKVGGMPLSIMGDYIQNLGDPKTTVGVKTGDTGYQAGFILGKASDPQTWEAAYFYKLAETDATLADISDSDFGQGGLNRKGHIVWVAYNPTKFLQGKVKYLMTEVETATGTTGANNSDINRVQFDLSMKF